MARNATVVLGSRIEADIVISKRLNKRRGDDMNLSSGTRIVELEVRRAAVRVSTDSRDNNE